MANFMAPSEAYQFRGQFGAPTYTSVILEHVLGGILRHFEPFLALSVILRHLRSFLVILGGILGRFWIGAFWGIASSWGPRGRHPPTSQHPPTIPISLPQADTQNHRAKLYMNSYMGPLNSLFSTEHLHGNNALFC